MRTRLASLGAAAALATIAAGAGRAAAAAIRVIPAAGSPTTTFSVRFRAPDRTGTGAGLRRRYVLSADAPAGAAGCVSSISLTVPPTSARQLVTARLRPRRFGGVRWCPGLFRGQVQEIESPVCPPLALCPAFVAILRTVGRVHFRVRPPDGDVAPPRFAGLAGAFACTPGAQRPGQTTPFTLSWRPASDNRTPASKLVYDIYESTVPGGENFLRPTWTSLPGASGFRTPGLPAHGAFYFVVRARDQAGNEDANTVERAGVDPCL